MYYRQLRVVSRAAACAFIVGCAWCRSLLRRARKEMMFLYLLCDVPVVMDVADVCVFGKVL